MEFSPFQDDAREIATNYSTVIVHGEFTPIYWILFTLRTSGKTRALCEEPRAGDRRACTANREATAPIGQSSWGRRRQRRRRRAEKQLSRYLHPPRDDVSRAESTTWDWEDWGGGGGGCGLGLGVVGIGRGVVGRGKKGMLASVRYSQTKKKGRTEENDEGTKEKQGRRRRRYRDAAQAAAG
ncbi:hypothetical protein C8R44DRAFT_749220 [Mycena epipterygia]|nr:hypothetical protein C8R44DRAFT_749220 [Mycena epipterygia]